MTTESPTSFPHAPSAVRAGGVDAAVRQSLPPCSLLRSFPRRCWTTSTPATPRPRSTWPKPATWSPSKIDGIRYLEKPPLPYWIDAGLYRIFGQNVFATHLPNALAMLGLRLAGLAVGTPRLGSRAPASMPPSASSPPSGRFSLRASPFPRRCSAFCSCSLSTAFSPAWSRIGPARFYWHVGRARPGHAHQGPHRAGLLCRRGHSPAAAQRPMAALAPVQALHRPAALPGHRRALAHPLPDWPIPTRATPSATTPPSATSTASGTSTSSTNTSCASSASAFRTTTTSCPFAWYWLAPPGLALPVEPLSARRAGRGLEDPPQLAAAPAPRRRPDRRLLPRQRRPRRRGQLRRPPQVPRAHHLAAEPVLGLDAAVLLHLHQPGVLHLPGLAAAADPHRRRAGRH